jgi:hypothetical protein
MENTIIYEAKARISYYHDDYLSRGVKVTVIKNWEGYILAYHVLFPGRHFLGHC